MGGWDGVRLAAGPDVAGPSGAGARRRGRPAAESPGFDPPSLG